MKYIKENLSKEEVITKEVTLSKLGLINPVLWTVLTMGFGLPITLFKLAKFFTTEQAVTNRKVMKKTGIIGRDIDEMRLNKIETVEFKQNILGRVLGYGDVIVTGTGGSNVVFNFVSNPRQIKNDIDDLID